MQRSIGLTARCRLSLQLEWRPVYGWGAAAEAHASMERRLVYGRAAAAEVVGLGGAEWIPGWRTV